MPIMDSTHQVVSINIHMFVFVFTFLNTTLQGYPISLPHSYSHVVLCGIWIASMHKLILKSLLGLNNIDRYAALSWALSIMWTILNVGSNKALSRFITIYKSYIFSFQIVELDLSCNQIRRSERRFVDLFKWSHIRPS